MPLVGDPVYALRRYWPLRESTEFLETLRKDSLVPELLK